VAELLEAVVCREDCDDRVGNLCRVPGLIAALLFRRGLVLLIAGVTFVRRDGMRASRLRVFWRGLVRGARCVGLWIVSPPQTVAW